MAGEKGLARMSGWFLFPMPRTLGVFAEYLDSFLSLSLAIFGAAEDTVERVQPLCRRWGLLLKCVDLA
jgi:hypothetical protein